MLAATPRKTSFGGIVTLNKQGRETKQFSQKPQESNRLDSYQQSNSKKQYRIITKNDQLTNCENFGEVKEKDTSGHVEVDLFPIDVALTQEELDSIDQVTQQNTDHHAMRNSVDICRGIIYRRPIEKCDYKPLNLDYIVSSARQPIEEYHSDEPETYVSRYRNYNKWTEMPNINEKKKTTRIKTVVPLDRHPVVNDR